MTELYLKEYEGKPEGIYEENIKISEPMGITKVFKNIDDETIKIMIWFYYLGEEKSLVLSRHELLTPTNLIKNQDYGLDITKHNANKLIEYFRQEEKYVSIEERHSMIGFARYKDKYIYKLYDCIGSDSKYDGTLEIKPKGQEKVWWFMFENHILGNVNLEFILCVGLSSTVLGFIGDLYGLDTILVHIEGQSTTGKSTAAKLAISQYAFPDTKKSSLYINYNSTMNALFKQLTGLVGVPIAIDEFSMSNAKSKFGSNIYKLISGTDKLRLNKDSSMKEREFWKTTVISTGEKPILSNNDKNVGLHVRVIELSNIQWTKSARDAELINSTIINNYGHIGKKFAKYMMDKGLIYVSEIYKKYKDSIYKRLKENGVIDIYTDRRVSNFALIFTSAKLFEEMSGRVLNKSKMLDLIIDVEKESIKKRNFNKSALDFIIQYINSNKSRFSEVDATQTKVGIYKYSAQNPLGKIKKKNQHIELEMLEQDFDDMISQGGFESSRVVLKELKNSGHLDCESDRYTRKRMTSAGVNANVYVIKIPRDREI